MFGGVPEFWMSEEIKNDLVSTSKEQKRDNSLRVLECVYYTSISVFYCIHRCIDGFSFISLSIHPSSYLSIYLSTYLSIYLSIYLSTHVIYLVVYF